MQPDIFCADCNRMLASERLDYYNTTRIEVKEGIICGCCEIKRNKQSQGKSTLIIERVIRKQKAKSDNTVKWLEDRMENSDV